jgi:hypothetical protein
MSYEKSAFIAAKKSTYEGAKTATRFTNVVIGTSAATPMCGHSRLSRSRKRESNMHDILETFKQGGLDIVDLFSSPQQKDITLSQLHEADIVMGHDLESDNVFLVYGRELVQRGAATNMAISAKVMCVKILQSSKELELLLAAVMIAKGHHDYQSDDDAKAITELERMFALTEGMHRTGQA